MKKNKLLSALLLGVLLCCIFTNVVFAQENSYVVLNSSEEITDFDLLIDRAKKGITDFEDLITANVKVTNNTNANAKSLIENQFLENSFEVFNTTQLLGTYIIDDKIVKRYAASAIARSEYSKYGEKPELKVTIYFDWVSASEVVFKYTSVTVHVTGAKSLVIENSAYSGFPSDKWYINSQVFPFPTSTYTLSSPTSVPIGSELAPAIRGNAILTLSNFSKIELPVDLNL